MPIYEYECPKCGTIEIFQGIRDDHITKCTTEKCKCKIKRVLSPCVSHFVGTGFYQTDYGGSSPSKYDSKKPTEVTKKGKKPKK